MSSTKPFLEVAEGKLTVGRRKYKINRAETKMLQDDLANNYQLIVEHKNIQQQTLDVIQTQLRTLVMISNWLSALQSMNESTLDAFKNNLENIKQTLNMKITELNLTFMNILSKY